MSKEECEEEEEDFDEEDGPNFGDEDYDTLGERERLKSLGLEDSSKSSFNRLIDFHKKYEKEEEDRKKKSKDERKPFLL